MLNSPSYTFGCSLFESFDVIFLMSSFSIQWKDARSIPNLASVFIPWKDNSCKIPKGFMGSLPCGLQSSQLVPLPLWVLLSILPIILYIPHTTNTNTNATNHPISHIRSFNLNGKMLKVKMCPQNYTGVPFTFNMENSPHLKMFTLTPATNTRYVCVEETPNEQFTFIH